MASSLEENLHFLEFHALGNVQDISGFEKEFVQYRATFPKHQEM